MMISLAALLYNFYGGYYNGTPDHGYFETHTYERNDFSHTLLDPLRAKQVWRMMVTIKEMKDGAPIGEAGSRIEARLRNKFPDGFQESDWTAAMGTKPTQFEQNGILYDSKYTTSNFTAMLAAGIVILPKSGCWLYGWGLVYEGTGRYWSSTCADANGAMALIMNAPGVMLDWTNKTEENLPVRLVKNVE